LGKVLGGDTGRDLVRAADEHMTKEAIKQPARFVRIFAPGFAGRE
jgi:hypothetical protein